MTQLDVPQVSLTRYVDLLKRRRWQVVPISLLGLLIGGIVAFFIPRYYVAETSIAYQHPPGEKITDREDPFGAIIDTARLTIPRAIVQTIEALGWPEAVSADPFQLRENVRAIEENLQIRELGDSKERSFAVIRVTYMDRDGVRAASFLNELVKTWIGQRLEELKALAEVARAAANKEHKKYSKAFETFLSERRHLQSTYRILPSIAPVLQRDQHARLSDAHQALIEQLADRRAEVATMSATLENRRKRLTSTPARIPADPMKLNAMIAETEAGKELIELIVLSTAARDAFHAGTPPWHKKNRMVEFLSKKLAEMRPPGWEVDADGMMPNPDRVALRTEVDELELRVEVAHAAIGTLQDRIKQEGEALERQAEGYELYEVNAAKVEEARLAAEAAAATVAEATQIIGKLTNQPTVRQMTLAHVPPAPTEPNLVLVALIGCVIGLFAATGLILLLDVLQSSFKTIEDVERSLDVAVLGGISYLETEAERRLAVRGRRRATFFAAAVLTLISGVVLIYYYDPTRLPPFVRDVLAIVLGTA